MFSEPHLPGRGLRSTAGHLSCSRATGRGLRSTGSATIHDMSTRTLRPVNTGVMPCCRRPSALMPRNFCYAITGLRADVGKGRAYPTRLLDGELLLLVRAFCPVQRRRTDAVLLLCSIAALVGPAGPFPPIRPKACHGIALSVRATVAKYPSPCYQKGVS